MKSFFTLTFPFIVISLILFTGCGNRDSLLEKAKINKSDVPVVLTVDPSTDRTGIPSNTVVSARFSVSMDTASVESAFNCTVDGEVYTTDGNFEWFDDNRMFIYYPGTGGFPAGSLITARIDVSAKSVSGIHLSNVYEWSFTPGTDFYSGNPTILNTTPSTLQAVQVSNLKIVIEFDRLMLRTTVESSFLLESDNSEGSRSADNGSFTWESTTNGEQVTYTPDEALGSNNTYTLYLNNGGVMCRDLAGNILSSFEITFYTADTAIYVSNDDGDDANEGFHKSVPVQTIDTALARAQSYGISLIKLEGEGSDPDYVGSFSIPAGITIQGGWNRSFDQMGYTTSIKAGSSNNYAFWFSGVSGCTLENLIICGGDMSAENEGVLINNRADSITIRNCDITGTTSGTDGYGIIIDSSSNITIDSNSTVSGGCGSSHSAGIDVRGTAQNIRIKNNGFIEGGSNGKTYGIFLEGGAGPVTIEDNTTITGGNTASSTPTCGIYISSNAVATVSGNASICGGSTSNGDTFGIYVSSGADVHIFRNWIIGGTSYPSMPNTDYGLYVDTANECILFNNFIRGSTDSSDMDNDIYGVYAIDTDIVLINNTIGSGGDAVGASNSYTIYIKNNPWIINPYIINNIILEGTNITNIGIRLINDSPPIESRIFNNSFRNDKINNYIDGTGIADTSIVQVNSDTNIVPTPQQNNEFSSGDISFTDESTADFHINSASSDTSSIKDNGYTNLSTLPIFTANPSLLDQLLKDIDGTTRNAATIDRGAQEFSP